MISEIEFEADEAQANTIFDAICTNGKVDFNTLIPVPPQIYRDGFFLPDDDSDFKNLGWHDWRRENWGTKWNAETVHLKWKSGLAEICFQNPWSVPYPFIIAFGNKFLVPFKLKFHRDDHLLSGEEEWITDINKRILRFSKKLFDEHDKIILDQFIQGPISEDLAASLARVRSFPAPEDDEKLTHFRAVMLQQSPEPQSLDEKH